MADKKITELTSLTELAKDDLFVVVDDPSGTPITKKITAEKVLSGLAYTASNSSSDSVGVKAVVTLAGNTTLASATLKGAEFIVNVTAASQNTSYQYGLVAKSLLSGATANVKVEHAAGKFVLDVSNATGTIANTTGLMIEIANTGVRVANLQSFIMLDDKAANSTTAQTLYLFGAVQIRKTTSASVCSHRRGGSASPRQSYYRAHQRVSRRSGVADFVLSGASECVARAQDRLRVFVIDA
jgi:hypothetical protein